MPLRFLYMAVVSLIVLTSWYPLSMALHSSSVEWVTRLIQFSSVKSKMIALM